jgi:hypothetical protein
MRPSETASSEAWQREADATALSARPAVLAAGNKHNTAVTAARTGIGLFIITTLCTIDE